MIRMTSKPQMILFSQRINLEISKRIVCSRQFSKMTEVQNSTLEVHEDLQINTNSTAGNDTENGSSNLPLSSHPDPSHTTEQLTMTNLSGKARRALIRKEKYKELKRKNKGSTNNLNPGYSIFSETEYYFENGLRKVYPYFYAFSTFVKSRWFKRTLCDIFTTEFSLAKEYDVETLVKEGHITVNGKAVPLDYKIKQGDIVENCIHRHENPVTGERIEVIEDNKDLIVVNKPSSIPCHPCGGYRYNSVIFILGKELGYANLRIVYRLDRLTSGILIFTKNEMATRKYIDDITKRNVEKVYVCRVDGKFPDFRAGFERIYTFLYGKHDKGVHRLVAFDDIVGSLCYRGEVVCEHPIAKLSSKLGIMRCGADGKPSKTTFNRLSYNGKSSVVQCKPYTGRTHQIRVHLQYLGFPIVNDPCYNSLCFGPEKGKGGNYQLTDEQIHELKEQEHNKEMWTVKGDNPDFPKRIRELKEAEEEQGSEDPRDVSNVPEPVPKRTKLDSDVKSDTASVEPSSCTSDCDVPSSVETSTEQRLTMDGKPQLPFQWKKWFPSECCPHCKKQYQDPKPSQLRLYLHAISYKGPDWHYQTPMPTWAEPDWEEEDTDT